MTHQYIRRGLLHMQTVSLFITLRLTSYFAPPFPFIALLFNMKNKVITVSEYWAFSPQELLSWSLWGLLDSTDMDILLKHAAVAEFTIKSG